MQSDQKTTPKPRICHVCSGHHADDGRVFRRACVSLVREGYDVHLIARSDAAEAYVQHGVTVHPLPAAGSRRERIMRRGMVADMAARIQPDVYHVHEPELLGPVIARAGDKPVVYDVHESYMDVIMDRDWIPGPVRPLLRFLWDRSERKLLKRCAAVIAATDGVAKRYLPLHGNVLTIANYPDIQEMLDLPAPERDGKTCVFTGTVLPNRGLLQAIAAVGILKGRGIEAPMVIAGDCAPDFLAQLMNAAQEAGVSDLVSYRGLMPRDEAVKLSNSCSIGLVPHLPYGNNMAAWPVKMMEYMALGLPLVYSDFPSHREIAGDLGLGIAVDPTEPANIADAIQRLIEDRALQQQMGEAGRRAASETFNWGVESGKLLKLYREILGAG